MFPISTASRCASGTPLRLIPTNPTFLLPSCFSTISCASRTSVRSISEADISRPFSRNFGFRTSVFSLITIALDNIRTEPLWQSGTRLSGSHTRSFGRHLTLGLSSHLPLGLCLTVILRVDTITARPLIDSEAECSRKKERSRCEELVCFCSQSLQLCQP